MIAPRQISQVGCGLQNACARRWQKQPSQAWGKLPSAWGLQSSCQRKMRRVYSGERMLLSTVRKRGAGTKPRAKAVLMSF